MCFSKKKAPTAESNKVLDRYEAKKEKRPELKEKNGDKAFNKISETGPMENRTCTDILFFAIFIAFICLNIWIAAFGFSKGDPWALAQPYDVDNNTCGKTGSSLSSYKYAYFFNPISDLTATICLQECPKYTGLIPPTTLGKCYIGPVAKIQGGRLATGFQVCDNTLALDFSVSDFAINTFVTGNPNRLFMYNSKPLLDRFCIPNLDGLPNTARSYYDKIVGGTEGENYMEEAFSDLRNSWGIILASAGGAFVLCIVYMFIMRWCVGIFVWLMILLFFAILLIFAIFFHRKANYYNDLFILTQQITF
jgi:hypothetical protein